MVIPGPGAPNSARRDTRAPFPQADANISIGLQELDQDEDEGPLASSSFRILDRKQTGLLGSEHPVRLLFVYLFVRGTSLAECS